MRTVRAKSSSQQNQAKDQSAVHESALNGHQLCALAFITGDCRIVHTQLQRFSVSITTEKTFVSDQADSQLRLQLVPLQCNTQTSYANAHAIQKQFL